MKTLYLVRHAKSSWEDPDLEDFDRPLNARGEKDAPRMGKRLKEQGAVPDAIYSSPARRAITTAQIIADKISHPSKIHADQKLYHADDEQLLAFLQALPDQSDCIMIVGHNPGLTEFTNALLDEDIGNIPTTGVIIAHLKINAWKDSAWGCGKLIRFDFPKKSKD